MFFPLPGTPGVLTRVNRVKYICSCAVLRKNCVKTPKNPKNGVLPGYYTPRAKLQELYIL